MIEMLVWKAEFNPVIAVAIIVTVSTPMMTPRVVSTERIRFARIADQEIRSPSKISAKKVIVAIGVNERREEPEAVRNGPLPGSAEQHER